jgi:hypothetical protein
MLFVGGPLWALWHLPVFLIPGVDQYGQSLLWYTLMVTAYTFLFTWVHVGTGRPPGALSAGPAPERALIACPQAGQDRLPAGMGLARAVASSRLRDVCDYSSFGRSCTLLCWRSCRSNGRAAWSFGRPAASLERITSSSRSSGLQRSRVAIRL